MINFAWKVMQYKKIVQLLTYNNVDVALGRKIEQNIQMTKRNIELWKELFMNYR